MRKLFAVLLFLFSGSYAMGQDTTALPTVIKISDPTRVIRYLPLANGNYFDSGILAIYKDQNVGVLLAQQSPVLLRNYGTNGLASLSVRGASSAQTAIQWNGVPIQNAATGIGDLSLFPVALMGSVELERGSDGAHIGSGAVGGVLFLSSPRPPFREKKSIEISMAIGSYGLMQGGFKSVIQRKKWFSALTIAGQKADNHFRYIDDNGKSALLTNSSLTGISIQGTLSHWIRHNTFTLDVWANKYDRQIPPALFEAYSVKEQKDASLRTLLSWLHRANRYTYGIQASLTSDRFTYSDSAVTINSAYTVVQAYSNVWVKKQLSEESTLEISIPSQYNVLAGNPEKRIFRTAIVGRLQLGTNKQNMDTSSPYYLYTRYRIEPGARAELVGGKLYALADIKTGFLVTKKLSLRGVIGNTYRTPTLNELYYVPGGNPDLKPERGWSAELGYEWKPTRRKAALSFTHSGTAFYRDIHDWILWFGGAIWTPHNIAEVVSTGIETENKLTYKRPHIIYQVSANATVISSKTVQSSLPGDGSVGHQIPYAPRAIAQGNIGFNTAQFRFNYNQTFTGDRYYNSDETGLLPAYATGNVQAGWLYKRDKWTLDLSIMIQNIWDKRYAEVSGRPAPGVNYIAGLSISHR